MGRKGSAGVSVVLKLQPPSVVKLSSIGSMLAVVQELPGREDPTGPQWGCRVLEHSTGLTRADPAPWAARWESCCGLGQCVSLRCWHWCWGRSWVCRQGSALPLSFPAHPSPHAQGCFRASVPSMWLDQELLQPPLCSLYCPPAP